MGITRHNLPGVTEIFSEYVRQRRNGRTQTQVMAFLDPLLARLRADARRQLEALIRSWEAREGGRQESPRTTAALTVEELIAPPGPDEDLSWLPQPAASAPETLTLDVNLPPHPSVEQPPAAEPIPVDQAVFCPVCGRANRQGSVRCSACGAALGAPPAEASAAPAVTQPSPALSRTAFGPDKRLLLRVENAEHPIVVHIHEAGHVVLGRSSGQAGFLPGVDLSPYGAADHGVSRLHARLISRDNSLFITDLGSVNHTFVNGEQLAPREERLLGDGDEIRLGRLALRVIFQQRLRRLDGEGASSRGGASEASKPIDLSALLGLDELPD